MKLSKYTIEILKNFATINQGILIKQGNRLRTMSVMKNIFAEATISEDFEKEFAIYDLSEFLSTLSIFSDCDTTFTDNHIKIKSGNTSIKYYYSEPSIVVTPPDKEIKINTPDFSCVLPDLADVIRAANIMKLEDLSVQRKDGGTICIRAHNVSTPGNDYVIELNADDCDTELDTFSFNFKLQNLRFMPGVYNLKIAKKGVAIFSHNEADLTYAVTLETTSK